MKIFYIGRFPPPYGGSTIKNNILYKELNKHIELCKFDTSVLKHSKLSYIKLINFVYQCNWDKGIICVSNSSLFKLIRILNFLRPKIISKLSIFVVGGIFDEVITNNYIDVFQKVKNIYVETNIMKENLNKKELHNVKVIPNVRNKPNYYNNVSTTLCKNNDIRLIYLGRICEKKGIFNIIEASKLLIKDKMNFTIDFYGQIDDEIEEKFYSEISNIKNISYKGVFEVDKKDVYSLLKNYDINLFPTKYITEGVPGTLIESKIAGNTIICSKWKNNDNIVINLKNGIVLENNTEYDMHSSIKMLCLDNDLLQSLKRNSFKSAEIYFIENYIEEILKDILA